MGGPLRPDAGAPGFTSGYYVDALAAVDIAVWDLFGRRAGLSLAQLLGGARRDAIPAYVSGLPRKTLDERCALAVEWVGRGFKAIKFAAAMSDDGIAREMAALREAVGPDIDLMVDLHWKFEAAEAIRLIRRLEPFDLYFAEAPVQPEDVEGQARVAHGIGVPLALGEEWRTVYEVRPRLERRALSIIQPEMGHTGVTQFQRIAAMAQAFHMRVIPHASISLGLFSVPPPRSRPPPACRRCRITSTSTRSSTGTCASPMATCAAKAGSTTCRPGRAWAWRPTTTCSRTWRPFDNQWFEGFTSPLSSSGLTRRSPNSRHAVLSGWRCHGQAVA